MTPVEITAIAGVTVSIITSLLVPFLLHRRAAKRAAADTEVVSWQSITAVLQRERDELRAQLDKLQGENRRIVRELDADYSAQLLNARRRITQLETEVAILRDELRRHGIDPPTQIVP